MKTSEASTFASLLHKTDFEVETTLNRIDSDLESSLASLPAKRSCDGMLIVSETPVAQPELVQKYHCPIGADTEQRIVAQRNRIASIITGECDEVLIVAGPQQGVTVANVLQFGAWAQTFGLGPNLLVLKANFVENPYEIEASRRPLAELAATCALAGEIAHNIAPQYFTDLVSLGIIDASCCESQLHREFVSGTSFPVAFCSGSDVQAAKDAVRSSSQPHHFLTVTKHGLCAVVGTAGNSDTFLVLKPHQMEGVTDVPTMLDVGKVSDAELSGVIDAVSLLLEKRKLVGINIDTGDFNSEFHKNANIIISKIKGSE